MVRPDSLARADLVTAKTKRRGAASEVGVVVSPQPAERTTRRRGSMRATEPEC